MVVATTSSSPLKFSQFKAATNALKKVQKIVSTIKYSEIKLTQRKHELISKNGLLITFNMQNNSLLDAS